MFIVVESVAGLAVLAVSAPSIPLQEWSGMLLLAVLCGMAQMMPVRLRQSSTISVSAGVTFAGLILYGPVAAIWINLGSAAVTAFRPNVKPLHKILFNVSAHSLAAAAAGISYMAVGGTSRPVLLGEAVVPVLLAAAVYYAVQTGLISGIIALTEQTSFLKTWDANYRGSILNFVGLGIISLSAASAGVSLGNAGIIIFSLPLVMAWYGFKYIQDSSSGRPALNRG